MIFYPYFENFMAHDAPPTLYSFLNDFINHGRSARIPSIDFSSIGRSFIFDFDYPVSEYMDKEVFEKTFIDYFLIRRIGFETFTAWKIALRAKLNIIMPLYKAIYDAMGAEFSITAAGSETRVYTEDTSDALNRTESGTDSDSSVNTQNETSGGETDSSTTADMRHSDTPQNRLTEVQSGEYVSQYDYNTGSDHAETTTERQLNGTTTINRSIEKSGSEDRSGSKSGSETITRIAPTAEILIKFNEANMKLFQQIFDNCEDLFYGLMD